jgi:hypothetical protein
LWKLFTQFKEKVLGLGLVLFLLDWVDVMFIVLGAIKKNLGIRKDIPNKQQQN